MLQKYQNQLPSSSSELYVDKYKPHYEKSSKKISPSIIGCTQLQLQFHDWITKVIPSNTRKQSSSTLFVQGPTGVGKTVVVETLLDLMDVRYHYIDLPVEMPLNVFRYSDEYEKCIALSKIYELDKKSNKPRFVIITEHDISGDNQALLEIIQLMGNCPCIIFLNLNILCTSNFRGVHNFQEALKDLQKTIEKMKNKRTAKYSFSRVLKRECYTLNFLSLSTAEIIPQLEMINMKECLGWDRIQIALIAKCSNGDLRWAINCIQFEDRSTITNNRLTKSISSWLSPHDAALITLDNRTKDYNFLDELFWVDDKLIPSTVYDIIIQRTQGDCISDGVPPQSIQKLHQIEDIAETMSWTDICRFGRVLDNDNIIFASLQSILPARKYLLSEQYESLLGHNITPPPHKKTKL